MSELERSETPAPESASDRVQAYLGTLRRSWVLVVGLVAVTAATAFVLSATSAKEYEATAKILLDQNDTVSRLVLGTSGSPSDQAERDLNTHLKLVKLEGIALRVRKQLGLDGMPTAELLRKVDDKIDGNSNILSITARDGSPKRAAAIANAFASEYRASRERGVRAGLDEAAAAARARLRALGPDAESSPVGKELASRLRQLEIASALQSGGVQLVAPAVRPETAAGPRPRRSAVIGMIVGLLLAFGVVLVRERIDTRLYDEQAAELAFGLPVLATLRRGSRWRLPRSSGDAALDESYRTLASRLLFAPSSSKPSPLMVVSPGQGAATSSVVLGLARALTALGERVIVIEADLRSPRYQLRLADSRGLASVLAGRRSLHEALIEIDEGQDADEASRDPQRRRRARTYSVLPAGAAPPDPQRLLAEPAMAQLVEEAAGAADFVLIEAPPIRMLSDTLPLSYMAASILMVAERGRTTEDEARRAVRIVQESMAAPALGVAFADQPRTGLRFRAERRERAANRLLRLAGSRSSGAASEQILAPGSLPQDRG
jgi:succinoglycan biosynthesis transport protein ExoP